MEDQQDLKKSTWPCTSLETFVEHYARMALIAGAIDHARFMVRKMEADETRQWIGLGKLVAARIKEIKDADLRN
jgi:hypothetical protein